MVSGLLQGLRFGRLWWAVGAGLVVLVIWLSLTPDPLDVGGPEEFDPGHFIAYAVLMFWFAQLLRPGRGRVLAALALMALGVGLEFAQLLTDYRHYDVHDMRDDAVGVAVGYLLAMSPLGTALAFVERRVGSLLG
jgi:VanZ family protein